MSKTLTKVPKPKNVKEAIALDEQLVYEPIDYSFHKDVWNTFNEKKKVIPVANYKGYSLNQNLLEQLARYNPRPDQEARLIIYNDQPIRAVSGLFRRIPLAQVWEEAIRKLGEPTEEFPTTQAIVCQFDSVFTKYKRDGSVAPEDYELKPTIAFSYNFAERSFALGFVIGVFFCTNQMFLFFEGGVKVIHTVHHMKRFNLREAIENLVGSVKTVEEKIDEAQRTPVPEYQAPVLYWKGTTAKLSYLKLVWEQHNKNPANSMWTAMNHITWVTTHQISNNSTSFDMSSKAGSLLYGLGKLYPDDYVRALGFYMKIKRERADTSDKADNWLDTMNVDPLKSQVRKIVHESLNPPTPTEEEPIVGTERLPFNHSLADKEQQEKARKARHNIPID